MPFVASGLRKLAEGLYRYNAGADTAATVVGSGYFNEARRELKRDDVIVVIGNNRGTIDTVAVSSADKATPVTTVSAEGITAT